VNDLLTPWVDRFDVDGVFAPVIVACSGGADSTAMLALASAVGLEPIAVHVDHGLRPQSAFEGEHVREIAQHLGVAARSVRVDVGHGAGLEARAREARHAALAAEAEQLGARAVLIGHTMDDVAETVLMNVLRGAAGDGLAGIAHPRPGVHHPMLELRRSDTLEICRLIGVQPLHDPMNDERQYRRVWIRRELLPSLVASADRDLIPVLARQAEVLRAESNHLDEIARAAWPGGRADAARLVELPLPIARRAVRAWLGFPPPSASEVDAVLEVAHGRRRAVELAGGRRVTRSRGVLTARDDAVEPVTPRQWSVPGQQQVRSWMLDARVETGAPVVWPDGVTVCVRDADALGEAVVVRAAHRGERIDVHGGGSRSVAELLARDGVPPRARAAYPVVADAATDTIIWIPGVRVGRRAAVGLTTTRYAWLSLTVPNAQNLEGSVS